MAVNGTEKTILAQTADLQVSTLQAFSGEEKESGFLYAGELCETPKLICVQRGSLHCIVDGQDFLLQTGELVVCAAGQWYMQYADVGVAPRVVSVDFCAGEEALKSLGNRKIAASPESTELIQRMQSEWQRKDSQSSSMLLLYLNLLLLTLLRQPQPGAKKQSAGESRIICAVQQFIAAHARQKLSVPLVAQQVDVSPSYLTALFQKNLRISPGEYIRRVKLQESKQMIKEKERNFTEIAAALQYSTVYHFSRQFKEKFGITPTEYAKSVR